MANLLEKSSIVLTPTAYDNGKVLCVKPSDGSGDFDFSRNSSATRVNAQGLVEDVQILSGDLVQNGDFSEEGAEEVSNGSFSQEGVELLSQPVNLVTDFSVNSGGVIVDADTFETFGGTYDGIRKENLFTVGKIYKLTIEGNTTSSGFNIGDLLASGNEYGSGFGTFYFTAVGGGGLWIRQNTSGTTNITSFSIVEVGQDWTLGTGWSIGEDKAIVTSTQDQQLKQTLTTTIGKSYKVSFEILDITEGSIRIYLRDGGTAYFVGGTYTSSGVYDFYFTSTETLNTFTVYPSTITTASITNISVKEVGMDWTLGAGWSIGTDKAVAVSGTASKLRQTNTLNGKTCKVTLTVSDYSSGLLIVDFGSTASETMIANGDYVFYGTYDQDNFELFKDSSFIGSTTNISVKEITNDTNLPRINYEGFSYQDALGSEEIADGNFTNQAAVDYWGIAEDGGVPRATKSLEDGFMRLTYDSTNGSALVKNGAIPINNRYKVTFRAKGTANASFVSVGNNGDVGTVISNPTLTNDWQNYGFYIDLTSSSFRVYLSSVVIGSTLDITNISVKEYLGQEVVPNSGCGSLLFEPQSTNLITYSEDFSQWILGSQNVSIIPNNTISPSGILNATKLIVGTSNNGIYQPFTSLASQYTGTMYIKTAIGTVDLKFGFFDGTNIDTDTITVTDTWTRFEVSKNLLASSSSRFWLYPATNGTKEVFIWGAMLEAQSYATSYIPTEGTTVTRNQDLCTNGGDVSLINSTEGVLYAEISALADDGSRYISISDGTSSNAIKIYYFLSGGFVFFQKLVNGVRTTNVTTSITKTDFNKIAIRYNSTEFSVFANGVNILNNADTNVFAPNTLNTLQFTDANGTIDKFFGKTKALAVWKEALSDTELTELTTI